MMPPASTLLRCRLLFSPLLREVGAGGVAEGWGYRCFVVTRGHNRVLRVRHNRVLCVRSQKKDAEELHLGYGWKGVCAARLGLGSGLEQFFERLRVRVRVRARLRGA